MKFDKVQIELINLAIKDFKEKGFPEGFKASAYFDIEIISVSFVKHLILKCTSIKTSTLYLKEIIYSIHFQI